MYMTISGQVSRNEATGEIDPREIYPEDMLVRFWPTLEEANDQLDCVLQDWFYEVRTVATSEEVFVTKSSSSPFGANTLREWSWVGEEYRLNAVIEI